MKSTAQAMPASTTRRRRKWASEPIAWRVRQPDEAVVACESRSWLPPSVPGFSGCCRRSTTSAHAGTAAWRRSQERADGGAVEDWLRQHVCTTRYRAPRNSRATRQSGHCGRQSHRETPRTHLSLCARRAARRRGRSASVADLRQAVKKVADGRYRWLPVGGFCRAAADAGSCGFAGPAEQARALRGAAGSCRGTPAAGGALAAARERGCAASALPPRAAARRAGTGDGMARTLTASHRCRQRGVYRWETS